MPAQETILLTVDIAYNNSRLADISKELKANADQVKQLNKEFKDSAISADFLAAAELRLKQQAKQLRDEAAALTKANEAQIKATQQQAGSLDMLQAQLQASRAAYNALSKEEKASADKGGVLLAQQQSLAAAISVTKKEQQAAQRAAENERKEREAAAGSIDQLRAKLSQLTAAYNALSAEERDNTEAGQKLQAEARATSDQLKVLESAIGDNRRNVGNYTGAIGPLIQELVKLQEQQKTLGEGSAEYKKVTQQIGFVQKAAQEAGAKAGLSYEQTQAKLREYGEAVRPVIKEVVKLEQEQEKLDESSEAYTKIGFQIAGLKKKVEEVPVETKKLGGALKDAAGQSQVLSGAIGRLSEAKNKYTAVVNLAKVATMGEVGALGALKLALIATGVGAFVVVLGSLIAFLTKTQTGIDFVARQAKAFGVVVGVLTDKVSGFGEQLFNAFSNPKQALSDLVDFIGDNLLNRLKAFGVIVQGIVNLDATKVADGFVQLGTGITDATAKAKALGAELAAAARAGQQIEAENQRIRDSERAVNVERAQAKKDIEALKLLAEDQTKAAGVREEAARKAFALEQKTITAQLENQRARIKNLEREQALTNNLTADNDALAEERIKLAELEEGSLTRQTELQNKINEIRKSAADKAKADRDKAQQQQLADIKAYYEVVVLESAKGSRQELENRVKQINALRDAELRSATLTANQRKAIIVKALEEELRLREEFEQKAQDVARKAVEDGIKVAGLQLQEEQKQYDTRLRDLNSFLDKQRSILDRRKAEGEISEDEYQQAVYDAERMGLGARIELARKFRKDTTDLEKQVSDLKIAQMQRVTDRERAENKKRADAAYAFGSELGAIFADTLTQSGVSAQEFFSKLIILIIDSLEKTILAAQIEAASKTIAQNPTPLGFIQAAGTVAAITAAFEVAKAAIGQTIPKQFADGGFVSGPGGPKDDKIPAMLSNGESVINARSTAMFGPVLSWMNEIGGGAPFQKFAVGGLVGSPTPPVFDGGFAQRSASEGLFTIDYDRLAQAVGRVRPVVQVETIKKGLSEYDKPRARVKIGGKV